ncbi:MAG TPA: cytochrome c [Bryobacteraceae bacterium]|nr:cytochrome c [Bryobacteraceae bacterium]
MRQFSTLKLTLVTAGVIVLAGVPRIVAQTPSSVWDGVYTDEQAVRGEALYQHECASCHGTEMEGIEESPPLLGKDFKADWNGQALSKLFDKMRTSMPADHPGKLSAAQNADILAWILKENGFPHGASALTGDENTLKQIQFDSAKPEK